MKPGVQLTTHKCPPVELIEARSIPKKNIQAVVEATGLNDQSTRRSRPTEDGQLLRVSSSGAWKEEEDDSHMAGRFISFALNYNAAFSWVHRVGEMLAILSCSLLSAGSAGCIARYISEVGAFCLRS